MRSDVRVSLISLASVILGGTLTLSGVIYVTKVQVTNLHLSERQSAKREVYGELLGILTPSIPNELAEIASYEACLAGLRGKEKMRTPTPTETEYRQSMRSSISVPIETLIGRAKLLADGELFLKLEELLMMIRGDPPVVSYIFGAAGYVVDETKMNWKVPGNHSNTSDSFKKGAYRGGLTEETCLWFFTGDKRAKLDALYTEIVELMRKEVAG